MRAYRRSRTDYPAGVVSVYDNGGKTIDRYTVVYEPYMLEEEGGFGGEQPVFTYVAMSGAPFHPQGFCQHGETVGFRPTTCWGSPMGRVIAFDKLPADCQRAVRRDLEEP